MCKWTTLNASGICDLLILTMFYQFFFIKYEKYLLSRLVGSKCGSPVKALLNFMKILKNDSQMHQKVDET